MRKLIAMALLGVGAVVFAASAPVQAMPAGNAAAGVVKQASNSDNAVEEVRRRHRHWRRHHHHRHWRRHHHRRFYRPYYYGYPYYYYPRYYRRGGVQLYFGF
jgi:Ni/Co efflux regulator RcnB